MPNVNIMRDGVLVSVDSDTLSPPSPEQVLAKKRASAVLSRAEFIQAVYAAGILSKQQAVAAAAGGIPDFFIAALNALVAAQAMTQAQADGAEILWAGLTQVERNHPFLPIAQGALSLTEAQVDALFGIS